MATNNKKTVSELEKELLQTVQEVGELLRKSGLAKADEDEVGDPSQEHAEPDADQMGGPSDQDADNMSPEQQPAEAPPEQADAPEAPQAPEEGQPSDESSEMAAHASELSDEELQSMLEVLMAEVEKRHANSAPAAAPEAPAAAPQPQQEQLAQSMKGELSSLAKSVADIAEVVRSLTGDIGTLKKSQSAKQSMISKPAATRNVQVLQKSAEVKEKLNKSDTLNYLLSEQKNGNKRINSDIIATVNACRSDSDLHDVQKSIEKMGIKLP